MRRLPRAFFWIDQSVIRSGAWLRLSAEARLAYVALAASCDREGISIWTAPKLMELSASGERENWNARVSELEREALIERVPEHSPPAIRIRELEVPPRPVSMDTGMFKPGPLQSLSTAVSPIIVHTQTTIHLGGTLTHVESGKTD
jgi:hypothetical protein